MRCEAEFPLCVGVSLRRDGLRDWMAHFVEGGIGVWRRRTSR